MQRENTQAKKTKRLILSVGLALCLLVGAAAFYWVETTRPVVTDNLTIEAGQALPEPAAFALRAVKSIAYDTTVSEIDSGKTGVYPLVLNIDNRLHTTSLTIEDTTPPEARVKDVAVWLGTEVTPDDFVEAVTDAGPVTAAFDAAPDTDTPGGRTLTIVLTDQSGNTLQLAASLTIYQIRERIDYPLNTDPATIHAADFVHDVPERDKDRFAFQAPLTGVDFNQPGINEIAILFDGIPQTTLLGILDKEPPAATAVPVTQWVGDPLTADDFVADIRDDSPVAVRFQPEPDNTRAGTQTITLLLTDAFGNTATIESQLTLTEDTQPPKISGQLDKSVFLGGTVAYRSGITLTDNRDSAEEITLTINAAAVRTNTAGTYTVTYTATDRAGNKAAATGTVTVFTVTAAQVNKKADQILEGIIKDDMKPKAKAQAIYNWVRSHVSYVNNAVKDTVLNGAYRAFTMGKGDCYTYYAASEILLTRAGIENMVITRIPGTPTRHYWSLIKIGGGWYHFDTTPHIMGGTGFMMTDSEAEAYTKKRGKEYYTYDKSLYPEVVP